MMKALTAFSVAFAICFACSPIFADVSGEEKSELNCKLSDGTIAKVEVLKKTIDASYPYNKADLWGIEIGADSNKIISYFKVEINGKRIFVPLSAYADLGNPRDVGIRPDVSKFDILINGGQNEKSYLAVITFDFIGLLSKKVSSAESAGEVWEETIYTFVYNEKDN